jgi:Transposase DDE domain
VWLWHSHPEADQLDLQRVFRVFLRRFDIEHTFRFLKQTLGWTRPRLRTPQQADRWTWLTIAAYTQLRLARGLAADLRRPWEAPLDPERLTPARVRRGFPRIRRTARNPASAPKPTRPGPGRPKGSRNRHKANRYTVGKQPKVDTGQSVIASQRG